MHFISFMGQPNREPFPQSAWCMAKAMPTWVRTDEDKTPTFVAFNFGALYLHYLR